MKTVKKWVICLSLIAVVSATAVGCGNTSDNNAADETKTTVDDNHDNLGDDLEKGVDDVGDAIDDGVKDVEEGAEDLTDDMEGTDTATNRTNSENTSTQQ